MKLLLLDSHALIHRAYHAIQTNLTSPTGEPTNATYGFASTVLRVLNDEKPDLIAATFDVGKSFRDKLFAGYKGNRPELADDLRPQLQRSRELMDALSIPAFGMEGYEADDLLGTLARQASERGIETVIVTGDTDTLQLVTPQVRVLMFTPYVSGNFALYDEKAVQERYQLAPKQLIDFKALKGDTSDNVPGVAGIGEKTATKLVQMYGSVEGIYEHLDQVEKRWQEKIRAGEKQAFASKKLVTIVTDAPIQLDPEKCRVHDYDRERIIALFRELGFKSLIDRLPTSSNQSDLFSIEKTETKTELAGENYHTVDTVAALDQLVGRLKALKEFVFDVETTSTDPMRAELVGIAIGAGNGEAYYVPVLSSHAERSVVSSQNVGQMTFDTRPPVTRRASLDRDFILAKLKPIFEDEHITKAAHNAKYDMTVFAEAGVNVRGLAFDSMIAAHLVEPSNQSVGLKNLVFLKFGVEMTEIEALIGKGKNQISMAEVDPAKASAYACADANYTYRLVEYYKPLLAEQGVEKLFHEIEMPLVPVLMDIERTGVLLDLDVLKTMSADLTGRLQELDKQIQSYVGAPINIASPIQLGDALFNRLKLPTAGLPKTKTGQYSTAADVLESLRNAHPIIPLILQHRELSKLKGTYVDALPALVHPRTGRVHTDYNQTGTVTGRVSSSNPNLQNIPVRTDLGKLVRRAFIAPSGSKLISADYSQVELRILAHITHDPGLVGAFERGEDIHAATAARLFNVPIGQVTSNQRRLGKTINFGIAYGITDYGVAARTELSVTEARQLIDNYFTQFAGVKEYIERTKHEAGSHGYVQTLMGRRRYFPELRPGARVNPSLRNAAEREAINMPIQGSAADIIKIAMIRLHRELRARGLKTRMTLQVHDELVFESPDNEISIVAPLICEMMENSFSLDSKLKADLAVGQNWDEMSEIKV
ncbi:MAG: DNA polymerase I [Chloroflexi bacterium]|nr:DNA polymerase I [Chloroflexota bacterium]